LAAADRLPHLAQLLRAGTRALPLALLEERGRDPLGEVLLLHGGEPASDPLPEVPALGAHLNRARIVELGGEHAPEAPEAQLVAGVAEAGAQQEAREIQPTDLVVGRAAAPGLERPERVPEQADGGERPRVAPGVECAFQPAPERYHVAAAFERAAQQ